MHVLAYAVAHFLRQGSECFSHLRGAVGGDDVLWLHHVDQIPQVFPCSVARGMDVQE